MMLAWFECELDNQNLLFTVSYDISQNENKGVS